MHKRMEKLSVLLPTFNSSEYVGQAIKSILNQTFSEFEFLIIDDGSTDNTEEIVKSFNDDRIVYVKKKNSGLASTLNFGLQMAAFDWIARMDSDDICEATRLDKQIKQLVQLNQISCTWCTYFKDNKVLYTVETPIESKELKKKLAIHSYICHSSVIYNRNFILANGGYNEEIKVFEDYELWLRLKDKIEFKVLPEYLVYIRIRNDSLSQELSMNKNIIYNFQSSYYRDLTGNFSIIQKQEKQKLFGWREFFYGDKAKARIEWKKLGINLIIMPKIILAFIISFLPERYFRKIIEARIRYRMEFYLNKILNRKNSLQNKLNGIISELKF